MAVFQINQFTCQVPAGTAIANPAVFPMVLPNLDIVWLEWEVPPGPRGNVGFWIGSHGQQIIPFGSGAASWIVTDDRFTHWDLVDQPDSGDWELRAYNLGVDPHTIYVRWGLGPPTDIPVVGVAPLAASSISNPGPGA